MLKDQTLKKIFPAAVADRMHCFPCVLKPASALEVLDDRHGSVEVDVDILRMSTPTFPMAPH